EQVDTLGTAQASEAEINAFARDLLDTSVKGIIAGLDLRRPIYLETAAYGHFGRGQFGWEKVAN
ncbi:MAG TPA: methionine adenosyltransferase domain-containing protein, partial [Candidatus Saccharimonadales bacterium]|nr:methionine adenosyltransferase domain-containing protein [Candidatus Saccharimonadales bacterium]